MSYLHRIQRGIDYIEDHLEEDLAIADIARQAGLSRWHFQRVFFAMTNETIKSYVRSRRLGLSLDRLRNTELRILDIAIAAGFESQEAFCRAFKKAFAMTPSEYRRIGRRGFYLKKAQVDEAYLRHIGRDVSLTPEIIEQPARRFVGLRTRFFSADSEKNNVAVKIPPLWDAFMSRLDEIPHRLEGVGYGIVRQTSETDDLLEYHAAMEVSTLGDLPCEMCAIETPAATYAKFVHRGPLSNLDRTVNYAYSTWLSHSGLWHTQGPDIEVYGSDYHEGSPDSVMSYMIPISPNPPTYAPG